MLNLEDAPKLAACKGVLFRACSRVPGVVVDRIEDKPLEERVTFAIVVVYDGGMVESYHALEYTTLDYIPYWKLVEDMAALMRQMQHEATDRTLSEHRVSMPAK